MQIDGYESKSIMYGHRIFETSLWETVRIRLGRSGTKELSVLARGVDVEIVAAEVQALIKKMPIQIFIAALLMDSAQSVNA